jgi:hypothetical protein
MLLDMAQNSLDVGCCTLLALVGLDGEAAPC